jgi:hypothetical protein
LVAMNEKSTYIRNAFDVGPECGGCATKETDVLRAKVVFDDVDRTTRNLVYLVCSRWAGRHAVGVCGRDELPSGSLTLT